MSAEIVDASQPPPFSAAAPVATRSRRLGLVAMYLGLGVFIGSIVASILMGISAGPYAVTGPNGFNVSLLLDSGDPVESRLAVLAFVHVFLGTVIGVWALTQGIVAIATRRGRAFGVVALVAAFLAPGISLVVYFATAIANAP